LPEKGQRVLEQVGKESLGALKILQKIGFHYLRQCCPFDGGPHYGADWKEVRVFKKIKELSFSSAPATTFDTEGLVALEKGKHFYLVRTPFLKNKKTLFLPASVIRLFQKKVKEGSLEKFKAITLELPL
jgi:arginine N-succinyltransferase